MTTTQSHRRSSFGLKCIQYGSEQIAPERSEYWSDRHAFHMRELCLRHIRHADHRIAEILVCDAFSQRGELRPSTHT